MDFDIWGPCSFNRYLEAIANTLVGCPFDQRMSSFDLRRPSLVQYLQQRDRNKANPKRFNTAAILYPVYFVPEPLRFFPGGRGGGRGRCSPPGRGAAVWGERSGAAAGGGLVPDQHRQRRHGPGRGRAANGPAPHRPPARCTTGLVGCVEYLHVVRTLARMSMDLHVLPRDGKQLNLTKAAL